jgi:glyceraldehyde 3-phosphate dehydrogenase
MAIRVPTPNVSIVDLTAELKDTATEQQINDAMRAAAGPLKNILACAEEELCRSTSTAARHRPPWICR